MDSLTAGRKFEGALTIFGTQVAETTQFWFAAATMNEVAKHDDETLAALNLTPSFWITVRVAMEYQAILSAAKIFGPRRTNPHNIDFLFEVVRGTRLDAFSKEALEARKRQGSPNADEWIADYVRRVHVLTAADVKRLHQLSSRHRKTYENQFADVRNLHVAHNVLINADARSAMFQKTRIRDFEQLVVFLNQLQDALREAYNNGRRPVLRPMPYSIRRLVARKLKDLREGPTHEHIVAETRMCMDLLTRAVKTLPNASRRNLRWS